MATRSIKFKDIPADVTPVSPALSAAQAKAAQAAAYAKENPKTTAGLVTTGLFAIYGAYRAIFG